jgi:hypothetical protein
VKLTPFSACQHGNEALTIVRRLKWACQLLIAKLATAHPSTTTGICQSLAAIEFPRPKSAPQSTPCIYSPPAVEDSELLESASLPKPAGQVNLATFHCLEAHEIAAHKWESEKVAAISIQL